MKLWLGAEEMTAELALTAEQVQTGMMFRTNLAENAGMLFVFPAAAPRVLLDEELPAAALGGLH